MLLKFEWPLKLFTIYKYNIFGKYLRPLGLVRYLSVSIELFFLSILKSK